jgi:hypothetical protein
MRPDYSFSASPADEELVQESPPANSGSDAKPRSQFTRSLPSTLLFLVLAVLLYSALRDAPFNDIWLTLTRLQSWQLAILLFLNAIVIIFMTLRWWLILRAEIPGLPFIPLIGYRLSVFAMSYFTPGPQVGGEPLQIILLRRNHHVSFARASSAVLLDKVFEFLGNFVFIGIGLFAIARVGLLAENITIPKLGWIALAILVSWPIIHFSLLYTKRKPMSALIRVLLSKYADRTWYRLIVASEYLAASFIHRHPRFLFFALLASLISWSGMGLEYLLMLQFLDIHLTLWQALAGLTAALLAFLVPLPGGLGALEASQVLALGSFGYSAATAIGLTLLMRARDLVNGLLGLWLVGGNFRKYL